MDSNQKVCLLFGRETIGPNRYKDKIIGVYDLKHINNACNNVISDKNHSAYFFYVDKNKSFN